jgi:putative membrane protein
VGPRRSKQASNQLRAIAVTALGVALICYLVTRVGLHAVLAPAASIGWRGFALLCFAMLLLLPLLGAAWGVLQTSPSGVGIKGFIWARMMREAASDVLPFSQIGGMALGVRSLTLQGVPSGLALGTLVVDVTTELAAQIAYVALVVLLIWENLPHTSLVRDVLFGSCVWVLCAILGGGAFFVLQRYGSNWIAGKFIGGITSNAKAYTAAVVCALGEIYGSPKRVMSSLAMHFIGWLGNAACSWIAFCLVGASVSLTSIIALEGLVYAARSAGFFVPGALGVQEAAYAGFSQLFGVDRELALAVSLLKRARDLAIGVPVLLIWKTIEGTRAFAAEDAAGR